MRRAPVLGPYHAVIDQWLREDVTAPPKQRHTATRIADRLAREYGAPMPYSNIADYVARRRPQILVELGARPGALPGFVERAHAPGADAEVDFGELWVVLEGERAKCYLFALRLCCSGRAIHRAYSTMSSDSFLDGHAYALRVLGAVPAGVVRYDNLKAARHNINAAIALLDALAEHDTTLATARQRDLEARLANTSTPNRKEVGNFVRWAKRNKLTSLDLAAIRRTGATGIIDTGTRWQQALTLPHDENLDTEDRVAGLLVLLYAQRATAISRLTISHVTTGQGGVFPRLSEEPVLLPEPLDALIMRLVADRTGHATIGASSETGWLFPGGQPGRPISAYRLGDRPASSMLAGEDLLDLSSTRQPSGSASEQPTRHWAAA